MAKQLHLNLFIHGRGHHEAAWRYPSASPLPLTDIRYYTDLAQTAEAGCFDSIFLADTLAAGDDIASAPRIWLEPLTALAALGGVTKRIGLIATCSTTYTQPFNLARQFASLDHITGGRVGWNIVTTWLVAASGNFGAEGQFSHAERYERAEEYMSVVKALWDSWTDDAVLDDRERGIYAKAGSIRPIDHRGRALPGHRTVECAARSARPSGFCPGGVVGNRPPLRRPPCRGGVHRANGKSHGEGFLH